MFGTQVQQTGSNAKEINKELSNNCDMYEPCPICFKCQNKATHLYQRCEECPVQFCGHSHKQRSFIIRRENFAIKVTDETGEKFKEAAEQVNQTCTCNKGE
ncbi:hypothetical protein 0305phi8-36p186 [Bacillus phage 0305phi8-36]|uniref:hypothetical protein n=1 Tax=Bacillus phage 0305phi8-36 TaxID=458639 RepID=UPI00015A1F2A|nr:hypothetical protein ST0305phi8-36p186 [Bacillus phage 0305phi8-36]ABS83744.1 hypothetical protein 0305phi8-36p186 [Bacillus phage 0305phi8-36]